MTTSAAPRAQTGASYVQGWLAGASARGGAALIPYELALRPGRGGRSHSGPVAGDVVASFDLAAWAVEVCLSQQGQEVEPCDMHLHFPLDRVHSTGPSCRLSLANSVFAARCDDVLHAPATSVLLGDVSLGGDVLPVGQIEAKVATAEREGLSDFVVAHGTTWVPPGAHEVATIAELLA